MRKIVLGFLLFVSAVASAQVKNLSFSNGYVGNTDFKVKKSITEGSNYIDVTYTFEGTQVSTQKINGKTYQVLNMSGASLLSKKSDPEMPYFYDVLAIGTTSNVKVSVKNSSYKEYGSILVQPSAGVYVSNQKQPSIKESSVYKSNSFYPSVISELTETTTFRGVPMATVRVFPMSINPVTKKLRCYSSITYRIQYTASSGKINLPKSMFDIAKAKVSNPAAIDKRCVANSKLKAATLKDSTPEKILIFTATKYLPAVNRFVKWKSQQGFNCKVFSASSFSASSIKSKLQTEYKSYGVPSYLIFFGDNDDVQAITFSIHHSRTDFSSPVTFVTDQLYANSEYIISGSNVTTCDWTNASASVPDYTPNIISGRISVSSLDEANTVVDKIIKYEQNPPTRSAFYKNAVHGAYYEDNDDNENGIGDNGFVDASESILKTVQANSDVTVARYLTVNNSRTYLPTDSYIPDEYRKSWNKWLTFQDAGKQILSKINQGINYLLYSGHGSSTGYNYIKIETSTVKQMNNGDELPFFFGGIACQTGMFGEPICFTEALLRKKNGGAIGAIGNSQYGWTRSSSERTVDLFRSIYENKDTEIGKAMLATQYNNLYNGGHDDYPYKIHICLTAHLFGDPTLSLYTQEPICIDPDITTSENMVLVNADAGDVGNFKVTLTSQLDPTDASKMKVAYGNNVKFNNVNYPYLVTIQKNNYNTFVGSGVNYIQNQTFNKDANIVGDYIYVGSNVKSLATAGPVSYTAGNVNLVAESKVYLKKGFKAKAANTSSKLSIKAKSRACNYKGIYSSNGVKSAFIDYNYIESDEENDMLDDSQLTNAFDLYPNPSDGIFNVSFGEEVVTVSVYDMMGKVVRYYSEVSGDLEIDLTDEANGIYNVVMDSEKHHLVKKVVKQ